MKYSRMYHLSNSPGVSLDDKIHPDELIILNSNNIVITEKMDGGNCSLHDGKVFSRSGDIATHESFDYLKNCFSLNKFTSDNKHLYLFGENMFATHSIKYNNLNSYFYLFDVYDILTKTWYSWDFLKKMHNDHRIHGVSLPQEHLFIPMLIREFDLDQHEGFVVRVNHYCDANCIKDGFWLCRAKWVRKNHVKTDDHWRNNWTKNKLAKEIK